MAWKIKDEYKDTMSLFDINSLNAEELKIAKQAIPEMIEKYFDEI